MPRCAAKKMLHALLVFETIKCRRAVAAVYDRRTILILSAEAARDIIGRNAFFRSRVNFHAITSREQQCFRATGITQNVFALRATREALARFDVCRVMTQPDTK